MRPQTIHLPELDGLRGLLALWVVLGHWSATIAPPGLPFDPRLHNGAAVGLFMLLSGFVISARIVQKPEPWRQYAVRRALRLFPAYLPIILLMIPLAAVVPDIWAASPDTPIRAARLSIARDTLAALPSHVAAHLALLHGLIPRQMLPATDFALVGQAWSLSLEWQFYLVAPFLVAAVGRPQRWATLLPGLLIILALASIALNIDMPAGFLGRHLPEFLGGIASWFLFSRLHRIGRTPPIALPGLAIAVAMLLAGRSAALAPAIWIVLLTALLDPRIPAIGRWLRKPSLQWLGARSYPIYLSHMLAMMAALLLLRLLGVEPALLPPLLLLLTLALTLAASGAIHRHVESPAIAFSRRLFRPPLEPVGREIRGAAAPLQAK